MPYFFYYLLKVVICSAVLFAYYHLFLRNKVYHAYNRFYLLAATVISLIVPFINFNVLFNADKSESTTIQLLHVVNTSDEYLEEVIIRSQNNALSSSQWMLIIYTLISVVLLFGLVKVWIHIYNLIRKSKNQTVNDIVFVESDAKGTPFSFFSFIFWNNAIDINSDNGKRILTHEIAHVKEKHSYDKLYINVLLILFWINPVFWFIKKELTLIHEFIADKKAIADHDAGALAAMIIQSAYPHHPYLLSNHFFYSPIKRRLKMLSKYNNKKAGYLYRILALPVVLFLIAALTIKAKSGIDEILNPEKKITVVIDAGHGGTDAGATGADKKTMEKEITLALIKKLKALNTASNIELVFTRETDIYQTPKEKSAISEEASPDLFISVHVASSQGIPQTKFSGLEVYVSKDNYDNSLKSKLFASGIIQQFKTGNYKLGVSENPIQRPTGIWVIQALNCPSVLIEAGYMNNVADLKYLQSDEGQTAFAKNLLAAISTYATEKSLVTELITDTIPQLDLGSYKGEKIRAINVQKKTDEVRVTVESGKIYTLTWAEAAKAKLLLPPPPPPAPPAPPAPPEAAFAPAPPPPPPAPLNEVVVIGYPNANGNDIPVSTDASQPVVVKGIQLKGKVNGLQLSGTPVASGSQPVYYLEGKEIQPGELNKLDPNKIKTINVLKGSDAINKYGAKAENGAIELFFEGDIEYNRDGTIKVDGKVLSREKRKNTLYIGVDNILHFSGSNGNLIAVLSDEGSAKGNISNTSGKWIAKFNTTGNAVINVMDADSKKLLSKYYFTVERLSDDIKDYSAFVTTLSVSNGNDNKVFTRVEEEAAFPGGVEAWKQYLRKNLNANIPVDEGWAEGTYQVIVQFTVNKDGSLTDISTINYQGSKTAQSCIDIIKQGPKWIPAKQNGYVVRSIRKQPITFVIDEQDPKPTAPVITKN